MCIYNVNDFHSIKEKRCPDTTTTSDVTHMATCICKPVIGCPAVPVLKDGTSVHNPAFVNPHNIILHLIQDYHGVFDTPYTERKIRWLSMEHAHLAEFERIELLTVHISQGRCPRSA